MTPERRARLIHCLIRLNNLVCHSHERDRAVFKEIVEGMSNDDLLATFQSIELIVDEAMGTEI